MIIKIEVNTRQIESGEYATEIAFSVNNQIATPTEAELVAGLEKVVMKYADEFFAERGGHDHEVVRNERKITELGNG